MSIDATTKSTETSDARSVNDSGAPLGLESMQAGNDIPILVAGSATPAASPMQAAACRRRSNHRVAWTLVLLCTVFFAGIVAARMSGDSRIGLITLGIAISLFLIVAIGRSLWK